MLLFLLPLEFFSLRSCSCSNYFCPSVTAQHAVDTSAWSFVAVFSLVIALCQCCSCSFGGLISLGNRSDPLSDFANVALRALLFFFVRLQLPHSDTLVNYVSLASSQFSFDYFSSCCFFWIFIRFSCSSSLRFSSFYRTCVQSCF